MGSWAVRGARTFRTQFSDWKISGIDNLSRPGSELNRSDLQMRGVSVVHGDLGNASDLEALPDVDWIIDGAANPSVLAGVDGKTSSRQVVENNLYGTVNLLEFCRQRRCGFILLSTSRVDSIDALCRLPLSVDGGAFHISGKVSPSGASGEGVDESFSTSAPLSLYGSTKLASEHLALECYHAFGVPIWINRCGVLAGAGLFWSRRSGHFFFLDQFLPAKTSALPFWL